MNLKEFINYGLKGKELKRENMQFEAEIDSLKNEIVTLTETISNLQTRAKETTELMENNEKVFNDTLNELNALKSPMSEDYYFKKTNQKYKWKPNKNTYLRDSLSNFSHDLESIGNYTEFLKSKGIKKNKDLDKFVYSIVKICYKHLESLPKKYRTDKEAFGTSEYWLTPQEAYEYYVIKKRAIDCEDFSAFIYGCLVSAFIYNGNQEHIWRIKRVDIKKPVAHAIIGYLNNRGQWKRIESTYYRSDFATKWNDDSDLFKSAYTIIWHIFDEESEYKLK